jgi:hypothetical protein
MGLVLGREEKGAKRGMKPTEVRSSQEYERRRKGEVVEWLSYFG